MRRCVTLVLAVALALPLAAQEIDADALWKALLTGNLTYAAGDVAYKDLDVERKGLVGGQMPPVTVLACSDSRIPPELVFNQSLGALFVVRSAGNVADEFGIAAIESAVSRGWTKLIVVLGHEHCTAVEEAMKDQDPPTLSLLALVQRIRKSFVMGQTTLPDAIQANVIASAAWLTAESSVVRKAVMETDPRKKVTIVPAYYELLSGKVTKIQ